MKVSNLYLDIITNHGNNDIKLTKVAPIPNITRKTGKAQQTRVLREVNRLSRKA